jgi:hypothetical protein
MPSWQLFGKSDAHQKYKNKKFISKFKILGAEKNIERMDNMSFCRQSFHLRTFCMDSFSLQTFYLQSFGLEISYV